MATVENLERDSPKSTIALTGLLVGPFAGVLDVYMVTVAAPSIRIDLGASFSETQLVVIAAAISTMRLVPECRAEAPARLDVSGALLSGTALVAILLPLMQGTDSGWPAWAIGMIAGGLVAGGVFVVHQNRRAAEGKPSLVATHLLADRHFKAGLTMIAILYGAGVSAPLAFILPYYYQMGLGRTALQTGLAYVPVGLGYALGSRMASRLWGALWPAGPRVKSHLPVGEFNGHDFHRVWFTPATMADRYLSMYREILDRAAHRPAALSPVQAHGW
jgi:hypothetical protein